MLAIFTSNQVRHEFGENYEKAVVKKTERHFRLVYTKKIGKTWPCVWLVISWHPAAQSPLIGHNHPANIGAKPSR